MNVSIVSSEEVLTWMRLARGRVTRLDAPHGGEAGGVWSWQGRSPIATGATLDLRSLCKWHVNEGGPDF